MEVKRFRFQFLIIRHFLYSPDSQKNREDEERHDWMDSSQLKPQDHLECSLTFTTVKLSAAQRKTAGLITGVSILRSRDLDLILSGSIQNVHHL